MITIRLPGIDRRCSSKPETLGETVCSVNRQNTALIMCAVSVTIMTVFCNHGGNKKAGLINSLFTLRKTKTLPKVPNLVTLQKLITMDTEKNISPQKGRQ